MRLQTSSIQSTMRQKQPRKIFFLGSIEITPREILLGIVALLVLVSLGLVIANAISNSIQETNELYYTSLKVDNDPNLMAYGMKTSVGRAMAYGEFAATAPVSYSEISGSYFYIERTAEEYTMHTRIVTETDDKGKTHTRTEIYYTWDRVWSDARCTPSFTLLKKTFDVTKIDIPSASSLGYVYIRTDFRYLFEGVSATFNGTLFATLSNNTIFGVNGERARIFQNQKIADVIADREREESAALIWFWIVYSMLTVGTIIGLFALENRWLEDK